MIFGLLPKKNDFLILTNDEDFLNLLLDKGFPPKVILLRTGNQSTTALASLLLIHKKKVEELYQDENLGVLEIF